MAFPPLGSVEDISICESSQQEKPSEVDLVAWNIYALLDKLKKDSKPRKPNAQLHYEQVHH